MHIQHVTFMVNNLEESIEFYETMTELTISRRFKAGPGEIAFSDKWQRRNRDRACLHAARSEV